MCVGELVAHRERLSRHIQGTNAELSKHKSNIVTLNYQLQTKVYGVIRHTTIYYFILYLSSMSSC